MVAELRLRATIGVLDPKLILCNVRSKDCHIYDPCPVNVFNFGASRRTGICRFNEVVYTTKLLGESLRE